MSIFHSLPQLGQCLTLKSASDSHLFLSISSSIITPVLKWHLLYISNTGFSCIFNRNPKFPKSSVHTYLFQRTFQVFVLPSWILNRWFILNPIIFSHINRNVLSYSVVTRYSISGTNTSHTGMGEENKRKNKSHPFPLHFSDLHVFISLYYVYFQKSKFFLVTVWNNVPDVQLTIKHSIYFCIST